MIAIAREDAEAVDRANVFPEKAVSALRSAGLLGAMVPTALGGAGLRASQIGTIVAELGAACASTGMIYAMHQSQVACLLGHGLAAPWHRHFLKRLAEQGLLLASVTSEVGVGSRMRSSRCAVEALGQGEVRLVKDATAISYGAHCEALLATARRAADAAEGDQVMVVAERAQCTLEQRGSWDALGMRGTRTEPFLLTMHVPEQQVVPAPFAEIAAASMVPAAHLFWCSLWLGIAADAVDRARAFLRGAARGGRDIPASAGRLADAVASLQALQARTRMLLARYDARLATAIAADAAIAEPPVSEITELNTLKIATSEGALEAARQAMLVIGFAGYQNATPYSVARHLRDLTSAPLMVSNDSIRAATARMLLDRSPTLGIGSA